VLSTDRLRDELFGDAAVQGPWRDIQSLLHQRIFASLADGIPVIVDATHARRPWRLAFTQALAVPVPVEWIGWWLHTPLSNCLEWNQTRERLVPEPVIRQMAAALMDPNFGPQRSEGFAAVVSVVPPSPEELPSLVSKELALLDRRIQAASNREQRFELHGYSRLLDLERLLYLLNLLTQFPELNASNPADREALEAILSPLPQGDLAVRAAAFLGQLHGACYADADAIGADLYWLERNGFDHGSLEPPLAIEPPAVPKAASLSAGMPPLGDAPVFRRVFSLIRHVLHHPFDKRPGTSLPNHLIAQLQDTPGAYLPGESASLRKDLEKILTPYGFRPRNNNVRHGYAIGNALLSAQRLQEVHGVIQQAAGRLEDPTAQDLLEVVEQRLQWGGLALHQKPPVRAFANRSIIRADLLRSDSLASPRQAEQLEAAISDHRRIQLDRYLSVASFANSPQGSLRVWPLQLLFHNIAWYLVYEEDAVGREQGLIRTERLDRLAFRQQERGYRRSDEAHEAAIHRLQRLLHYCGGIYFGDDLNAQLRLTSQGKGLVTLRFCCQSWSFAFIREGLQRYPLEHTRFSRPLPDDTWWHHPKAPHVLQPGSGSDRHPYPVELDLPSWTVERDVDLRNWLFGFGDGVRIDSPKAMQEEHRAKASAVVDLYPG
jgi:predicted kinase